MKRIVVIALCLARVCVAADGGKTESAEAPILAPSVARTPRINGPRIFGVRPGSPFLFSIPATGDRPMRFSADGLPTGLALDPDTGRISGRVDQAGRYGVNLHAANELGSVSRPFEIVVGQEVGLTPAMGWNNYNLTGARIDQKTVLAAAHAMVESGLAEHGWTYVNTDDGWQGLRGGDLNAIQPNAGFPDLGAMVREIHGLGLKAGIYSSPWVTTYDRHVGGSSEDAQGRWSPELAKANDHDHSQQLPFAIGRYHFAEPDARQFARWGFDYLKYDWAPIHAADVREMHDALRATGRDFIFSLSNNGLYTLLSEIGEVSPWANSWRTTDDVHDRWSNVTNSAFKQDPWAAFSRPGHVNDPDMLVIGVVGWSHAPHPTRLTPNEQVTQFSMWCLLSAPLILGCDLQKLDPFTLGLVTNDEVLDVDQDPLCHQATRVAFEGSLGVYAKPLYDGTWAVGLVNPGPSTAIVTVKWSALSLAGKQAVRDLWRQRDLGVFEDQFSAPVGPHGTVLIRIRPAG